MCGSGGAGRFRVPDTDKTSYLPLEQPLKLAVMADIHCFEQDDLAGDSTAYMFDR